MSVVLRPGVSFGPGVTGQIAGVGQGGVVGVAGLPLIKIVAALNLTGNLALALDAGDGASYGGTVQTWTDTSSGGRDFFRGADGNASTDDPTFNGTAGNLTRAEYFSFDSSDFFTKASSNGTFENSWHQDAAIFSLLFAFFNPSGAASQQCVLSTSTQGGAAQEGIIFTIQADNTLRLLVKNDAGGNVAIITNTEALDTNAWNIVGFSINEATGAAGARFFVNGVQETATSTYTSPGTGDAETTARIGARGDGGVAFLNSARLAAFAMWDIALTEGNFDALYSLTRPRFGI